MPPLNNFQKSCIAIAVGQTIAAPLQAATITVNSSADTSGTSGICTLRDAITSANDNASVSGSNCVSGNGADTIEFSLTSPATITLSASLPTVTSNITINGPGQADLEINGNNRRILINDSDLTIDELTLKNGYSTAGGAIFSNLSSTLKVTNSTFFDNGANEDGGAIFNRGTAMIINSQFVDNEAMTNFGGGFFNRGVATITNSIFTGNSAYYGGGIRNNGMFYTGGYSPSVGTITITNSTISGNSSTYGFGGGGGVSNSGSATIIGGTISENHSSSSGGGILNTNIAVIKDSTISKNIGKVGGGISNSGTTTISNSTISGNTAPLFSGGGINNASGATTTIINGTISGNSANTDGGGILNGALGLVTVTNSIISGNKAVTGSEVSDSGTLNTQNSVLGTKILTNFFAFNGFTPSSTDIVATSNGINLYLSEILSPLTNNGGPTQTHALPSASPAVDAGNTSNCPTLDQRGEIRGFLCDIGAFEFNINDKDPSMFYVIPTENGKTVIIPL